MLAVEPALVMKVFCDLMCMSVMVVTTSFITSVHCNVMYGCDAHNGRAR